MLFIFLAVAIVVAAYYVDKSFKAANYTDKGESGGKADRSFLMVTNPKEQISSHFNAAEFVCPDKCTDFEIARVLVERLETVRAFLEQLYGSGHGIVVHSGYRCSAHNKAVGGAINSFHMKGLAADVSSPGIVMVDLHKLFLVNWHTAGVGGLGFYDWGVHVDLGPVRMWDERTNKTSVG
jgi:uncharacterized protein YcbK (DUF882 family)